MLSICQKFVSKVFNNNTNSKNNNNNDDNGNDTNVEEIVLPHTRQYRHLCIV